MTQRRAVITGIGGLSPVGSTRESITQAVLTGTSGLEKIETFDPSPFRTPYGGEIKDFDPAKELDLGELQQYPDRYLQLALVAARRALCSAGLVWSRDNRQDSRTGIVVGTCNGGLKTIERHYAILGGHIDDEWDRDTVLLLRYHSLGKALAYSLGVTGPTWVVTTACSSSTAALGLGLELIENNVVDRILVGGADALCVATMGGFDTLKATADGGRTAPFSAPAGINLGEAAAFWVIEEVGIAKARKANIEGSLLGYVLNSDAYHPTAPDPRGEGAYRTISGALERAQISVEQLGCVNAHGTGTDANDRAESKGIAKAIGQHPVPVYSFKSQVGHCLGAAGIIEGTAGLLAMQNGTIPATVNFSEARPGCNLDYVPNQPREADYNAFVSCNYAFGGNNAGVVIGRDESACNPSSVSVGRRTVLTGSGTVSSLGLGTASLLAALQRGQKGLKQNSDRIRGTSRSKLAGYVEPFEARDVDRRLDLKPMNLLSRYATAAARLALKDAGLRVSPKEGLTTGVVTGVYVGPSEEAHMELITETNGESGDINGFTHIVANSTGGWVSNALSLKGYSCTVAEGADAGLFALLLSHLAISNGASNRILAGAADELYSRYFHNYDHCDMLFEPDQESDYRLRFDVDYRRVLAEGAGYLVAEEFQAAKARGAEILAEIKGFGMTTDIDSFFEPNDNTAGLEAAVTQAIEGAGWSVDQVGLVLWSPQGNRIDNKTLKAVEQVIGERNVPFVTSVFHTGLAEASSGTMTLGSVLGAWRNKDALWSQMTGHAPLDSRDLPSEAVPTLVLATGDLGYNLALAIEPMGAEQ